MIENIILIVGLEVDDHPLIYQDELKDEENEDSSEGQSEVDKKVEEQECMPYQ